MDDDATPSGWRPVLPHRLVHVAWKSGVTGMLVAECPSPRVQIVRVELEDGQILLVSPHWVTDLSWPAIAIPSLQWGRA